MLCLLCARGSVAHASIAPIRIVEGRLDRRGLRDQHAQRLREELHRCKAHDNSPDWCSTTLCEPALMHIKSRLHMVW